jgi:methyl-accepting chemotaxis protein
MSLLAFQMNTSDPAFWVLVFVAAMFFFIAVAVVMMAFAVRRVVQTVGNLERRAEPLLDRVALMSEQVKEIAAQGREVADQVTLMSAHLATASVHFSESSALIKEEVRELKQLVGYTSVKARDKVEQVSATIDEAQRQFTATTYFIHTKLVEPARELAAIMAGVRRGLEVLVAPAPKQIDQTYGEDELFIG